MRHPSPRFQLTTNLQKVVGIISLLNDFLISQGGSPLGFLNTWLYGLHGDGFEGTKGIIISGSNPGCGTDVFSAVTGWDPVRPARLFDCSLLTLADLGIRRSRVLEC